MKIDEIRKTWISKNRDVQAEMIAISRYGAENLTTAEVEAIRRSEGLDSPSTALDVVSKNEILRLLQKLQKEHGVSCDIFKNPEHGYTKQLMKESFSDLI